SSRHVRMDGTHTGKLSAESVRGRLAASARFIAQFCPQGDTRGKEFLSCAAGRNGFPLERGAFATRWNADAFSTGLFVGSGGALGRGGGGRFAGGGALRGLGRLLRGGDLAVGHMGAQVVYPGGVALELEVYD